MGGQLYFRVLGPLTAELDHVPVHLGGTRPRAILALLLLSPGRVVSMDRLVDGLWGERPPERAHATAQVHVSNLRRSLSPGSPQVLTRAPGYLLPVDSAHLDVLEFEELVGRAMVHAAGDRLVQAEELFDDALGLWRGQALEDLTELDVLASPRVALDGRRLSVQEDLIRLLARLGRHAEVVRRCEQLLVSHEVREGLWEQLMLALYREGRQAEALGAYRRCRAWMLEELGVEPTRRLSALERAILTQDPGLDAARPEAGHLPLPPPAPPSWGGSETVRAPAPPRASLALDDGTHVALRDPVVIGRSPACDVRLTDSMVSRRHAEIRPSMDAHVIEDLSVNGTYVNGDQVAQRRLRDGDRVRIGPHTLVYRVAPAEED